jgi:hypothetical protein
VKLAELADTAARLEIPVEVETKDLEQPQTDVGDALYDLIVVVNYLHRPLFPALVRGLKPGGLLLYETFTTYQIGRGGPTNPAFLLDPGELASLVAPLGIVRSREGEHEGSMIAAVAAIKP